MKGCSRTIVVSNRLPVTLSVQGDAVDVQPSSGGLVSALMPICGNTGGCWIGWPGVEISPAVTAALSSCDELECDLIPVCLTQKEVTEYYGEFCNNILWPVFHGLESSSDCDSNAWTSYCDVNARFASAAIRAARQNDAIWVHDYHLMLCGHFLRKKGWQLRLGYFHHIPFPSLSAFEKLPWRGEIIRALLEYDLIGFQTEGDKRNFIACAKRFGTMVSVRREGEFLRVTSGETYTSLVGCFPISIDFKGIANAAQHSNVESRLQNIKMSVGEKKLILGVDRLDYTKGLLRRLKAFEKFLEIDTASRGQVSFLQVVVPSREDVTRYSDLRSAISQRVGEINGKFATTNWTPITYLYRSISQPELLALYRAASVMLVTPLRDGMNLVAKEFCAARADQLGTLILSEFAGAAAELGKEALVVNPYDTCAVAQVLITALRREEEEQRQGMSRLRSIIKANDVFQWAERFQNCLHSRTDAFTPMFRDEHNLLEFSAHAV